MVGLALLRQAEGRRPRERRATKRWVGRGRRSPGRVELCGGYSTPKLPFNAVEWNIRPRPTHPRRRRSGLASLRVPSEPRRRPRHGHPAPGAGALVSRTWPVRAATALVHVLDAAPLGRQQEQHRAVLAAQHGGEDRTVVLDPVQYLAALANPDDSPLGGIVPPSVRTCVRRLDPADGTRRRPDRGRPGQDPRPMLCGSTGSPPECGKSAPDGGGLSHELLFWRPATALRRCGRASRAVCPRRCSRRGPRP